MPRRGAHGPPTRRPGGATDSPTRRREHTDLSRLLAEGGAVVDLAPGLGLPLVDHLVQHGVLDLAPRVVGEVSAAQRNLDRLPGAEVDAHLTQAGAHAAREPDRDLAEPAAEVLPVELLVQLPEPVEERQVAGVGPLGRALPGSGRVQLDRKREENQLGPSSIDPRGAGVQEADDGGEHPIGREHVALVQPEQPPLA